MTQILDDKTHTTAHFPYRQSFQTYHRAYFSEFPVGHETDKSGLRGSNLYFHLFFFFFKLIQFEPVEAQLYLFAIFVQKSVTSGQHSEAHADVCKGMMFTTVCTPPS